MADRRNRAPVKLCDICNRRMSFLASLPVGAPLALQRAYHCPLCHRTHAFKFADAWIEQLH
jgi:hypothetical protein